MATNGIGLGVLRCFGVAHTCVGHWREEGGETGVAANASKVGTMIEFHP